MAFITQEEFLDVVRRDYLNSSIDWIDKKHTQGVLQVPAAFDIEVSSFLNEQQEKCCCMYIWQFGLGDYVTYGRTWPEFMNFISNLQNTLIISQERQLYVYVHNLSYEFQFIRKFFKWDKVFLLEDRVPVYASKDGISFRCSLKLSGGKSLENVGKDLIHHDIKKLIGNLDYQKIRHSQTPLTQEEMDYCENDIRILLAYIDEKIEQDGGIHKIPLTNTGYVRNHVRKRCFRRYKHYMSIMDDLQLTPETYLQAKRAFQGGFTHARAAYVGEVLHNVASFDFTSSYPAVMALEKFPMSSPRKVNIAMESNRLDYYLENYCCMFDIELFEVTPLVSYDHPISLSRCIPQYTPKEVIINGKQVQNYVLDNGRLVTCHHMAITVTELDFQTIREFYDWDRIIIDNFHIFAKHYLPKPIVMSVLEFYRDKTALKGLDEQLINYMIQKNMLNSAYGMMVTSIVRDDLSYGEDDEFHKEPPNIKEEIDKYNKSKRRFLYYPWGVWVTAHARHNLFRGIMEMGNDYRYSDTDSLKVVNYEKHMAWIKQYNDEIIEKCQASSKHFHIDIEYYSAPNRKGEVFTIGQWDFEGVYDLFKTEGAKRYLVYSHKHGYTLTCAGLSKAKGPLYLYNEMLHLAKSNQLNSNRTTPFDIFEEDMTVPSDYTGKLTHNYIDRHMEGDIVDYLGNKYHYHELSGVYMEPATFTMSLTEEFVAYMYMARDEMLYA